MREEATPSYSLAPVDAVRFGALPRSEERIDRCPGLYRIGDPFKDPANDLAPQSAPAALAGPLPFIVQGLGDAAKKLPDRTAPDDHQHDQTDEAEQQHKLFRQRRQHGVSILAS